MLHNVTVKKGELIEVLRKNREAHAGAYAEARGGYLVTVKEWLAERAAEVDEALEIPEIATPRPVCPHIAPENHTADYDRCLRMLEMSVDDEVELDEHQFRNIVLDEWSWSEQFAYSNSIYASKRVDVKRHFAATSAR